MTLLNEELLLVVHVEKLTSSLKNFFYSQKKFKEHTLLIDCNTPKYHTQTISWIFQHARDMQITLNKSACELLFSYYENDFNALHHILYQLSIIYPKKKIDLLHIKALISDSSSHFYITHLLDTLLIGDCEKSARILKKIETDNIIKPLTILHAIQNIISNLIIFKRKQSYEKNTLTFLLNKYNIQKMHRESFIIALQRLTLQQLYQIITLLLQMEISIHKNHPNIIWHNFKLLVWLCNNIK